MKKKFLSIVMCIVLFASLLTPSVFASSNAESVYGGILCEYILDGFSGFTEYAVYDIDNNGTKELLFDFGGSDGNHVYGYDNGILINYGSSANCVKKYFQKNNSLFALCFGIRESYEEYTIFDIWIDKIVLNNNKIVLETIYHNPYFMQMSYEYGQDTENHIPEVAEFLNGAKEVEFAGIEDSSLLEQAFDIPPKEIKQLKGNNGHIYTLYQGKKTWKEAKNFCESLGGHLITITTDEEYEICRRIIPIDVDFWTGAIFNTGLEWYTGEYMDNNQFIIDIGEPSSVARYAQITQTIDGVFYITNRFENNDAEYFICETENKEINVILNGTELSFDQPPILDPAGRVLVPIRKIAEAMGDDVKWNQDLQAAFVEHKERALIIPLYTDHLYMAYSDKPVEWKKYDLDVPSQVQNGRTLTPVRAFCESLGATVDWDDNSQTVYIEYNGNYDYDSLSDETINGINMAYSIMREHNNISFEKYSEEIYAYLENSNSAVDNVAMSWGGDLFDGIVQLLSGEDATETAVKASLAQVISLLDSINRSDDSAEIINGIEFTKSGAEAVKAFSELPKENLRIKKIDDLNKLSETIPELESLSKAIKATGIAVDVLSFSAEQSTYLLADYAQNIAYLDNIEKYFMATSAGNDLLYKVIDDMREEYSTKWIHSLESLRDEGIDKVLSALADKATFGVFGIVNFAKDLTNELTGLSTSAKGLKEFYASCILNVAFDEAYYDMMEDVSGIHFHSDEMIDMFNMQRAVKATTYLSMNKIANSVDEISWDDRIDDLESATYILWE